MEIEAERVRAPLKRSLVRSKEQDMQKCLLLVFMVFFLCNSNNVSAQTGRTNDDLLNEAVTKIKGKLVQHYKPRMVVQNRSPRVNGQFVPVKFESCNLKWKLVARSGGLSYTVQQSLDLADLDSNPPLVLMSEMPRTDRWYFELRTLREERKVKGEWIVTKGSKIIDSRQYWSSRSAFEADSQEVAHR